jgi:hypothetical protein
VMEEPLRRLEEWCHCHLPSRESEYAILLPFSSHCVHHTTPSPAAGHTLRVDGQGSGGNEHRRPRRRHCVRTARAAVALHLDGGGGTATRGRSVSTSTSAASEQRQRRRHSGLLQVSNPNLRSPCLFQWMVGYVPL